MLLIHYNGRQIMEKLIAQGDPVGHPRTLIDGSEYEGLEQRCGTCATGDGCSAVEATDNVDATGPVR